MSARSIATKPDVRPALALVDGIAETMRVKARKKGALVFDGSEERWLDPRTGVHVRLEVDRNDESGIVTRVAVRLSARAPAEYRAEAADKLAALYPSAEIVVA